MPTPAALLRELRATRASFGPEAEASKCALLEGLAQARLSSVRVLLAYHEDLLFLRAFPGSNEARQRAVAELRRFAQRWKAVPAAQRVEAEGSGIAGTVSRPLMAWTVLSAFASGEDIDIDWGNVEDDAALDALVARLVAASEQDAYGSGSYSTREWVELARAPGERSLAWLLRAGSATPRATGFAAAWDGAEVPLRWALRDSPRTCTHAHIARPAAPLRTAFRRLMEPAAAHIARPFDAFRHADAREAVRIVALARAALAVRGREVHAMNHPNLADVHVADLGEGVELALIGVPVRERLALEANYGYLLMSHGVPIGYGGVSPLHRQANTGINVFDPFRGSEAAFLWAQMLRAFRARFGVRRFVINGYQFGAGNSEAIASGAYWFYYRLGFRPSLPDNAALAAAEAARLQREPGVRTRPALLRTLARGDLLLDLADHDAADDVDEALLGHLGAAIARRIATLPVDTHAAGERALTRQVQTVLGIRSLARWTAAERAALAQIAPYVALLDVQAWPATDRRALVEWLRAKGAATEHRFAQLGTAQQRFFRELAAVGRAEQQRAG